MDGGEGDHPKKRSEIWEKRGSEMNMVGGQRPQFSVNLAENGLGGSKNVSQGNE